MALRRFGVSLEDELLAALDNFARDNGFANRSQAIRFLIEKTSPRRNGSATTSWPAPSC